MTVAELICCLVEHDMDAEVLIPADNGDEYEDIVSIKDNPNRKMVFLDSKEGY